MILTVASYNIHKAEGMDRRVDLSRIALVLKEIDADLVGVQEVYRPQAEALAGSLGMPMVMGATRLQEPMGAEPVDDERGSVHILAGEGPRT